MAHNRSALLELLGEVKLTDVPDRIRVVTETLYQELIEEAAAAFVGAAPMSAPNTVSRPATHLSLSPPGVLWTTAGDLRLRIPKPR